MSAYMTGQTLKYPRTNTPHFCSDKSLVFAHKIFAPFDAPEWAYSSQELWGRLEKFEARYDAQLCRKIRAAIPFGLSESQMTELCFAFSDWLAKTNGTAVEAAIRRDSDQDAFGNIKPEGCTGFHLQMMESLRVLGADGFGEKAISQKVFKLKAAIIEAKRRLEVERERWSEMANAALVASGLPPQDPNPASDTPFRKIPNIVIAENRRGKPSQWMERFNREQQQAALDRELEELNAEIAELDLAIEQKTREKNENERIRTAALAALAADVRTTGGYLEESARLGAADGYFDRRFEQAAATEHARRAGQILSATRAVFTGAHGEAGLVSLLNTNPIPPCLVSRSRARVEGLRRVRDDLRLADQALAALPIDQTIGLRSLSRLLPSLQTQIIQCLGELGAIVARLQSNPALLSPLENSPGDVIDLTWLTSAAPVLATAELTALLDSPSPAFLESTAEEAAQLEQWQNQLIQQMGHPPEPVLWHGVFIGRVISCCAGAFAQGLGFDGQYVIHQTEHTLEEGDVVRVELRSGVPSIEVKHRAPRRAG